MSAASWTLRTTLALPLITPRLTGSPDKDERGHSVSSVFTIYRKIKNPISSKDIFLDVSYGFRSPDVELQKGELHLISVNLPSTNCLRDERSIAGNKPSNFVVSEKEEEIGIGKIFLSSKR